MRTERGVRALRRLFAVALLLALMFAALSGCAPLVEEGDVERLSVYATFYPIYALTDAVMRDVPDTELHCLVQPQDGCLRAYALSDWDAALLGAGADAVIAGGRGLESFEEALLGWGESGPAVSCVLYNLELYESKQKADAELESHLSGPNPHLYMSLDGAAQILGSISASMQMFDPRYANRYAENASAACERLGAVASACRALLADYSGRRVSLMNEALIYVARDYGLEIGAWIDRESGAALIDNELRSALEQLSGGESGVVLIEKQAPQALVDALEAAGYAVAKIDVFSTGREGEGFDTYLEAQEANARAIREAFGRADARKEEH